MTTALSIQSAEMSKGVKPSLRTRLFSKAKMLKAAKAVLPVAVLAAAFPEVAMATTTGTDLMKSGDGTVKATFGKGTYRTLVPCLWVRNDYVGAFLPKKVGANEPYYPWSYSSASCVCFTNK